MAYKQELVLTKWIRSYQIEDYNFIADKILTDVSVTSPGKYYVFKKQDLRLINDEVTIDGNSPNLETTDKYIEKTYAPVEYSISTFIKVNEPDILERSSQKRLDEKIKQIAKHRRFKKEYQMKTILDSITNKGAVTKQFDEDGAVIEKDLRDNMSLFKDQAGVMPNTLIIPPAVWDVMVMDDTLSERWTLFPGRKDQSSLDLEDLFSILFKNIKNIYIPTCMYTTGPVGNESEVDLWSDDSIYMLYIGGTKMRDAETAQDIHAGSETTFTWASIFRQKKETVGSWTSPNGKIKYYELTEAYDMQPVCTNAVLKIPNVLKG